MRDEMKLLDEVRPIARQPAPELSLRARAALLSQIAADGRGGLRPARRFGGRPLRRWVVPCLAIVGLAGAGVCVAAGYGIGGRPPIHLYEPMRSPTSSISGRRH
jgi:hypothetical protein